MKFCCQHFTYGEVIFQEVPPDMDLLPSHCGRVVLMCQPEKRIANWVEESCALILINLGTSCLIHMLVLFWIMIAGFCRLLDENWEDPFVG